MNGTKRLIKIQGSVLMRYEAFAAFRDYLSLYNNQCFLCYIFASCAKKDKKQKLSKHAKTRISLYSNYYVPCIKNMIW